MNGVEGKEPDPTGPDYSEDGVDLSLIRCFLSLTPEERLQALQDYADDMAEFWALNAAH